MAAYTTTQSSPGLLDTLRNTWGSRGNAKPALGLDLERSLEDLQRPKKGFLRSVVASFCLAPAVHGERTNPKLTDGLTDDEEDIDAASEATTEVSPPLSLRYTGLGQPWNMKREEAFRARLAKCRRSGAVLVLLRHGESEWNAKDQFTGWADVGMTDEGRKQAVNAGHRLAASGVRRFDDLHSSALKRTVDTLSVVLEALSGASLPKGPRGTVSRSEMPRGTRDQSILQSICRIMTCTPSTRRLLDGVARVSLVPASTRRLQVDALPRVAAQRAPLRRAHGRQQARRARRIRRGPGQGLAAELGLLAAAHE